jgi:hypothetical protein
MGRKPVKETIEHRITLGSKERMQLDQLITALNVKQFSDVADNLGFKSAMTDPAKMVLWLGSLATILEILGFETGLPTPVDAIEFITEYGIKRDEPISESNPSIFTLLQNLLSGEYGGYPGGY